MPISILAYLDAGSGSLIIQALVAGTAGVAVFARYRWQRIRDFFSRKTEPESEQ